MIWAVFVTPGGAVALAVVIVVTALVVLALLGGFG